MSSADPKRNKQYFLALIMGTLFAHVHIKWNYAIIRVPGCQGEPLVRPGSTELDSSWPIERDSPVMLSAAKHLCASRDRPFASLRVTRGDCSNGQGLFFTLNLA